MAVVTIRQLLDSGVHFGHQTRRWNPKMKRFILTERSGSHIIDLQKSLEYIDKTYDYVKETVAHGGTILFVGTKKQAQGSIAEQALRVGQPYVNQRWLGGLLTNFQTVSKRLARMKELEGIDFDDTTRGYTKKELLIQRRELVKLQKSLGGIRNLAKTPSAIYVVDTKKEHLAIDEAHKLGIPVIAILDTNCDPDEVAYPIPGNDDAIRSVGLLTRIVADAAAEGLVQRHQKPEDGAEVEPLAAWEAELLAGSETPASEGSSENAAVVNAPEENAAAESVTVTPDAETTDAEETAPTDVEASADEPTSEEPAVEAAVAQTPAEETPAEETPVAEAPVEENDADALVAEHEAEADASLVPEHSPESEEEVEAKIEAEATEAEKKPAKAKAKSAK
jgi:small subunit ribosomal protein S2